MERANKLTVKVLESGELIGDFFKTHKKVMEVKSSDTKWEVPVDSTKTGERESFRQYLITNAEGLGINWQPDDMRTGVICSPKYTDDEVLTTDVMRLIIPQMREFISKCKYQVEWAGMEIDEIVPKTITGKGTNLALLGIEDGKYKNTGNWSWADIAIIVTAKFGGQEFYIKLNVELVSGQLKKYQATQTKFNEMVRDELINANLSTIEELDPPKEQKSTVKQADQVQETVAQEPVTDEAPVDEPLVDEPVQEPVKEPVGKKKRGLGKK